jgi:hypothetical protein
MTVAQNREGGKSADEGLCDFVPMELQARIRAQRQWPSGSTGPGISLLLPTRGRPAQLRDFLDSVARNAVEPGRVEVVIYRDDDADDALVGDSPLKLTQLRGPRLSMSAYNSVCAAHSSAPLLMAVNDDVMVESPAWDAAVCALSRLHADGIFLGWPRDCVMNEQLATFPILSRVACRVLGNPFGTGYRRLFIDAHLMDVFLRLRRLGPGRLHYLPQVVFHHFRAASTAGRRMDLDDDHEFLRQAPVRQWQARRVHAAVEGRPCAEPRVAPLELDEPGTLPGAMRIYTKALLADRGLPWRRRAAYWIRFCGHYAMTRTPVGDWLSAGRAAARAGT